ATLFVACPAEIIDTPRARAEYFASHRQDALRRNPKEAICRGLGASRLDRGPYRNYWMILDLINTINRCVNCQSAGLNNTRSNSLPWRRGPPRSYDGPVVTTGEGSNKVRWSC